MFRKSVLAAALIGICGSMAGGVAAARDWNDGRHADRNYQDNRDHRDYRGDDRREQRNDRRRHEQYRDHRNNGYRYGYGQPRYQPAPRGYGYGYGYTPRRNDWRQPYGRGYRYWRNDRQYYVEPGRPEVELRFYVPLH